MLAIHLQWDACRQILKEEKMVTYLKVTVGLYDAFVHMNPMTCLPFPLIQSFITEILFW